MSLTEEGLGSHKASPTPMTLTERVWGRGDKASPTPISLIEGLGPWRVPISLTEEGLEFWSGSVEKRLAPPPCH